MIADVQNTISRVEYLLRNGFKVPAFLTKRVDGYLLPDGLSVIIDSHQDELDYLEELLNDSGSY